MVESQAVMLEDISAIEITTQWWSRRVTAAVDPVFIFRLGFRLLMTVVEISI